ncbi:hypothetical protein N4G70_23820 [Streptomyces sp. ASQP_92]|uniref:hypothetical protein n=1 Tax=Streptomyces sp. ASQP_92 TaxID=2979116 RepID=UPI0021C0474E|nr:hypothetical protein [Streptomyces sp. ASQP_92]MCT9091879.1 hypothetical protein [Streptomyces sp. ASQP_92]
MTARVKPPRVAAGAAPAVPPASVAPAPLGHAVLSRGVGERAGSASLAARRTPRPGGAPRPGAGHELGAGTGVLGRPGPRPDPDRTAGQAGALTGAVRAEGAPEGPPADGADRAAAPLDRFKDVDV